jgi:hypothetical protein
MQMRGAGMGGPARWDFVFAGSAPHLVNFHLALANQVTLLQFEKHCGSRRRHSLNLRRPIWIQATAYRAYSRSWVRAHPRVELKG